MRVYLAFLISLLFCWDFCLHLVLPALCPTQYITLPHYRYSTYSLGYIATMQPLPLLCPFVVTIYLPYLLCTHLVQLVCFPAAYVCGVFAAATGLRVGPGAHGLALYRAHLPSSHHFCLSSSPPLLFARFSALPLRAKHRACGTAPRCPSRFAQLTTLVTTVVLCRASYTFRFTRKTYLVLLVLTALNIIPSYRSLPVSPILLCKRQNRCGILFVFRYVIRDGWHYWRYVSPSYDIVCILPRRCDLERLPRTHAHTSLHARV